METVPPLDVLDPPPGVTATRSDNVVTFEATGLTAANGMETGAGLLEIHAKIKPGDVCDGEKIVNQALMTKNASWWRSSRP